MPPAGVIAAPIGPRRVPGADRSDAGVVREFSFTGSDGSYAALFDGTERVLSWDDIVWITRSVLLP